MTVEVNFSYDINGNLVEKISSAGGRTYYEYEEGKGNSQMFLNDPTEFVQPGFLHL